VLAFFPAPLETPAVVPFVTLCVHSALPVGERLQVRLPDPDGTRGGCYEKETTQCRITARDFGVN